MDVLVGKNILVILHFLHTLNKSMEEKYLFLFIKAPGQLKKPKTEKARGRPRLPTVVNLI